MSQTVAQAAVAQLAAAGVQRVYGVIGDAVFPFVDALARQRDVQFVAAMHETNAAYMASYEAKLTGRPTVCVATSGPGATNLATGLADAFIDGAPVLAITGQVPSAKIGTDTKQFFDQQMFFGPLTTSTTQVQGAEAALHALLAALNRSVVQCTATHVSIPKNVFEMPLQWTPLALTAGSDVGRTHVLGNPEAAFHHLANTRRPLVIVGLAEPEAVRASLSLAAALGAAVVAAQQAKGAVPSDHELLVGGIGEAHIPDLIQDADLMILVGDAPYELRFIPPAMPCIAIAPTYRVPPKHPLLAAWFGRAAAAIGKLREGMPDARNSGSEQWRDAIRAARRQLTQQVDAVAHTPAGEACNPYLLALRLSEHVAEDAILTVDVGAFSHWFDLGFRVTRQTVLASPRWRGIGFALPAAIGAQLASPRRQVVAIAGDGAFLQAMSELTTAARYRLPLLIVIVNNAVYDIERQKLTAHNFETLGTSLPTPDFVAVAKACGAVGLRASTNDELDGALKEAVRLTGVGSFDDEAPSAPSRNGRSPTQPGNVFRGRPVVLDVRTAAPILPHLVGAQ